MMEQQGEEERRERRVGWNINVLLVTSEAEEAWGESVYFKLS